MAWHGMALLIIVPNVASCTLTPFFPRFILDRKFGITPQDGGRAFFSFFFVPPFLPSKLG